MKTTTIIEKPIIACKASAIKTAREAGAKVVKLWLDSSSHEPYEGRMRRKGDYLYGFKAECDKIDLLHLIRG